MAMRRLITVCLLALSATALVVTGPVAAGAKKKASKPSITRVTPMRVEVGDTLTITGRNFKSKRSANTVIFRAPNGRSAFAKPRRASARKLVLAVPPALARLLGSGKHGATRFKLRVLAGTFSDFTSRRLSPVVTGLGTAEEPGGGGRPAAPGGGSGSPGGGSGGGTGGSGSPGGGSGSPGPASCSSPDHDGDLLANDLELAIQTDPCLADTDNDGVQDGYEYKSAVDLNNDEYQEPNQSLPYPGKRPYPNPLDPTDAHQDYDGDTLSQTVEQNLWRFSTSPASRTLVQPLSYSDGLQHSIYEHQPGQGDPRFPSLPAAGYAKQADFTDWAARTGYRWGIRVPDPNLPGQYLVRDLFDFNLDGTEAPAEGLHYDLDGNGYLSDEERDEDADGLMNFDENGGRLRSGWWASCYSVEAPYYVTYAGTDLTDLDSDGDGVRDGADDQDHDDFPNVMELSRIAASNPHEDDRELGRSCKLAKAIQEALEGAEPPIYWHPDSYGRVNPFNPCLPVTSSRTCNTHSSFEGGWAPFDDSPDWFALN
jgi:IPT/TIG domain